MPLRLIRLFWCAAVLLCAGAGASAGRVRARRARRRRDRCAQVRDITTEAHEIAERIQTDFGLAAGEGRSDGGMLAEADGARGVMLVDRQRGEQLFRVLFERHPDEPLLYFKRGEAYRATGRRKLAHENFAKAFDLFPPGVWRERARIAAMRTRSHHEPGR